jgi:hypothetical protein
VAAEKPIRRSTHVDTPDYLKPPPRPPAWPWAIAAAVVIVPATGLGGVGGLIGAAGLFLLVLALVALVTGEPGPLRLSNGRRFSLTAAAGVVLLIVSGGVLVATGHLGPGEEPDAASPGAPVPSSRSTPAPGASDEPDRVVADDDGPQTVEVDLSSMTAREALDVLPVKGAAAGSGYRRVEAFGESWLDVDDNGCDTRNDILQRDLDDVELDGACRVLSGTLQGPYTGKTIEFERGADTSHLVQIDHVVALKDAWRTGAQQLTQQQRVSLANDPINLLAVDGQANGQKGDGNAATWLPKEKGFRCEYIARQVSVKATYGLWVVPAERDAIAGVLDDCPEQEAFVSPFAPEPADDEREEKEEEPAPEQPAPPAPVNPAPPRPVPNEPAPVEPAPVEPAPVEPAPTEPAPSEPAPTEPAPTEPAPDPSEPVEPVPTEPVPTAPVPTEPGPPDPAPSDPASGGGESARAEADPALVHPGASRSTPGATGATKSGTSTVCATGPDDERLRRRSA